MYICATDESIHDYIDEREASLVSNDEIQSQRNANIHFGVKDELAKTDQIDTMISSGSSSNSKHLLRIFKNIQTILYEGVNIKLKSINSSIRVSCFSINTIRGILRDTRNTKVQHLLKLVNDYTLRQTAVSPDSPDIQNIKTMNQKLQTLFDTSYRHPTDISKYSQYKQEFVQILKNH